MVTNRKLQAIVRDLRSFCQANSDQVQADRYARFFTEGYDAYGVSQSAWLEKKAQLLAQCREESLSLGDALTIGPLLLRSGKYEEASLAIVLLEPFRDQFTPDTFQQVGSWLETGIRNWAHTDVLSKEVLSRCLLRNIVDLQAMSAWRTAACKWKRRAVPVTMVELLPGAKDVRLLLRFIEPMMLDDDRFVQQGLGWLLREAWKRRPEPVESFLLKWKESAPRKIYQYATEKMSKEQKEQYRRAPRR